MNIKNFNFLLCILLLLDCGCSFGHKEIEAKTNILTNENKPTETLCALLSHFNIEHNGTLSDIVEKTQKAWLRPTNVELFNLPDEYPDKMEELKPLFIKLGIVNDILPQRQYYDYLFILGGYQSSVRFRISWLIKLWNDGLRFGKIVVLTGQRPLDPIKETLNATTREHVEELQKQYPFIVPVRKDWTFNPSAKFDSEADMIKFIFDQTELPQGLRSIETVFIDVPMQDTIDGKKRRPSREDTLKEWLKTNPQKGTILAIINQPFIAHQNAVMQTLLPDEFKLETVGFELIKKYESVSVILDSLARALYQEQISLKTSK